MDGGGDGSLEGDLLLLSLEKSWKQEGLRHRQPSWFSLHPIMLWRAGLEEEELGNNSQPSPF